jgi:hypothetical protein
MSPDRWEEYLEKQNPSPEEAFLFENWSKYLKHKKELNQEAKVWAMNNLPRKGLGGWMMLKPVATNCRIQIPHPLVEIKTINSSLLLVTMAAERTNSEKKVKYYHDFVKVNFGPKGSQFGIEEIALRKMKMESFLHGLKSTISIGDDENALIRVFKVNDDVDEI